ncbi:hypothetical protein Emed_001115 [Eimeria media]
MVYDRATGTIYPDHNRRRFVEILAGCAQVVSRPEWARLILGSRHPLALSRRFLPYFQVHTPYPSDRNLEFHAWGLLPPVVALAGARRPNRLLDPEPLLPLLGLLDSVRVSTPVGSGRLPWPSEGGSVAEPPQRPQPMVKQLPRQRRCTEPLPIVVHRAPDEVDAEVVVKDPVEPEAEEGEGGFIAFRVAPRRRRRA